ncbi:hypothetical protein HDV00_006671 [Rhizophlyctis rosea]|nr:hypothetical protein HDV00_006671 [Rhizophlyctis rosea]
MFLIIDSSNSTAFKEFSKIFDQTISLLAESHRVPINIERIDTTQIGSLFTLFLHAPVEAFSLMSDATEMCIEIRNECIVHIELIEKTIEDIFGREANKLGDDFLRRFLVRFVLADAILRSQNSFLKPQHFPTSFPPLPTSLFTVPELLSKIRELTQIANVANFYTFASFPSNNGNPTRITSLLPELLRIIARRSEPTTIRALRCTNRFFHSFITGRDLVRSEARWRYEFRGLDNCFKWAARRDHVDIVQYHVKDVGVAMKEETLINVSELGLLNMVSLFLSEAVDPNARGQMIFETALAKACSNGHVELVKLLLAAGASATAHRGVALCMAVGYGASEIVPLLLDAGADVDGEVVAIPANFLERGENVRGWWNILICGVRSGNLSVVRQLLGAGAHASFRYSHALWMAARLGRVDHARVLRNWGADANGDWGKRPLVEAAIHGHLPMVRFLLDEGGADLHADDDTALLEACRYNHVGILTYLLGIGANVHCHRGRSMVLAAEQGFVGIMRELVAAGADVNALGGKALSRAAGRGFYWAVMWLTHHGANTRLRAALLHAAQNKRLNIVELIFPHMDDNSQALSDVWGRRYIRDPQYLEITRYLLEGRLIPDGWARVITSLATCGADHARSCLKLLLANIRKAGRRDDRYFRVVERAAEEAAKLGHGDIVHLLVVASAGRIGCEKAGRLMATAAAAILASAQGWGK